MLNEQQHFLQAQIQAAKTSVEVAKEHYARLCHVCTHVFKEQYDSAICVICEHDAGWWCPESPTHTCVYEQGEWCIHCGGPEERK